MESTTPFVNQSLQVQLHNEGVSEESLIRNGTQQSPLLTPQNLFNFLPPTQDVTRGNMDFPDFNIASADIMQAAALDSNLQITEACNVLSPFSSLENIENEASLGRQGVAHVENQISITMPSAQFELRSGSHHLQGTDIPFASDSFGETRHCSASVPSSLSNTVLSSSSMFVCDECKEQFTQLEDFTRHVSSSHPLQNAGLMNLQGGGADRCIEKGVVGEPTNSENSMSVSNGTHECGQDMSSSNQEFITQAFLSDQISHDLQTTDSQRQEDVLMCAYCSKICKTQELLVKHEALHPYKNSAVLCSKCGEILGNYMLLQEHRQYEDYLSSCDICGQLFPNEECMVCHIRNAHNDIDDMFEEETNPSPDIQALPTHISETNPLNPNIHEINSNSEDLLLHNTSEDLEESIQESPLSGVMAPVESEAVTDELKNDGRFDDGERPSSENDFENNTSRDIHLCERSVIENTDLCSGESSVTLNQQSLVSDNISIPDTNKLQKMKCRYCSKKCSTRKSLVRHERCHPYETASMKCYLCLEVVENYKALKAHKKRQGSSVSCRTCDQVCPNEICLVCHVRNVHNNAVYDIKPTFSSSNDSDEDVCEVEEDESDYNELVTQQYSVSRYTVSDPGAPLRITIKQEKGEVPELPASPTYSASTPPTPPTPSNQGPPTPSPPLFVFESEPSDVEVDDEYEPYASDQSNDIENGKSTRRKSSLRTRRKSSNVQFLSSSEESDHDKSGDFNFEPQSYSESEEDSEDDSKWTKAENTFGNTKRRTRKSNPISDDSDDDPDWRRAKSAVTVPKKRGRRRKGPLSDDSENDLDWGPNKKSERVTRNRAVQKKFALSDSDNDPEWRQEESVPEEPKKKPSGKRGRKKKLQVAFFLPAISVPKVKRPRARGLGGQKAQDAAAALAQAIEDMEASVPELKTVIKPVRRSVTKASLKRFHEIDDDEYNYLLDVKSEPKTGLEESKDHEQDVSEADSRLETSSDHNGNSQFSSDAPNTDQNEEQIVIKAEPYDFQDDEASQSTDLYFSKKFCETNTRYENSSSPSNKLDHELDEGSDIKKELRYPCKFCGRAMQYRSHLVRHLRRVHGGEGVEEVMRRLMKCRFCEKPYSNELSLINHEKLHDGTSKMKCNKCDERFDDKNALRRHQRKTHWEHQPVECEICKKQLSDNTCLKAHMKHMHGSEEKKVTIFTCDTCGRQLHTKTAFQNHVASKCGTNLLFPCDTCGKSFSFKGSLKAHQLLHSGVKSFLCKFCGKAFHQKGEMKRHERKHTGEKPFICEVCGRAFAYRESLLGHSAVHTGIKPFPCKACGMRFSCSGNLVKHRRSNNCKGFSEQSNNAVMSSGIETSSMIDSEENFDLINEVDERGRTCAEEDSAAGMRNLSQSVSMDESSNVSSEKSLLVGSTLSATGVNSLVNESPIVKQEAMSILVPQANPHVGRPNSVDITSHLPASPIASVIRSAPSINVKSSSMLQSSPKEVKLSSQLDVTQSYGISSSSNSRMANHFNPSFNNHENSMAAQNTYNSHNVSNSFSENHYRQVNQVGINDRRYMPFNMEGLAGRTDQYFDRQSLLRHEMSRQAMERTVDRQTSRFFDLTGGVQFSGMSVDTRAAMQPYAATSLPQPSYPNIHSGHLGNYSSANHSTNHANMYGSNAMMAGTVSFPAFSASNHVGMGYSPNNPIPAHSAAHSNSYPASHMSHLEALFGHLSHPGNPAGSSFPRLSSHNLGSPANPSYPSNHRV